MSPGQKPQKLLHLEHETKEAQRVKKESAEGTIGGPIALEEHRNMFVSATLASVYAPPFLRYKICPELPEGFGRATLAGPRWSSRDGRASLGLT